MTQQPDGVGNGAVHTRTIFRSQALLHYMQGREKAVLPSHAASPTLAAMWAVLGALLLATVMLAISYAAHRGGA